MKIEIEKPVIPQFVADWLESLYDEGGSKYDAIGIMFEYSSKHDKTVHDWYVDNKDTFITAVIHDYEVEQEPLHYAKIKGWEFATNKNTFWNYRHIVGRPMLSRLYTGSKEEDSFVRTTMTIEEWNKLGINDTNADFEEVEQ